MRNAIALGVDYVSLHFAPLAAEKAHEISLGDRTPAFGNLSELEDEWSGRSRIPRDSTPPPLTGAASRPSSVPSGEAARQRPLDAQSSARGTLIAIVLFLVVAAAASAAWFTGIIPHH